MFSFEMENAEPIRYISASDGFDNIINYSSQQYPADKRTSDSFGTNEFALLTTIDVELEMRRHLLSANSRN